MHSITSFAKGNIICAKAQQRLRYGATFRHSPARAGYQLQRWNTPIKSQSPEVVTSGLSGAATQIRTGDLILTKDVLYQLSHSSESQGFFLWRRLLYQILWSLSIDFEKIIYFYWKNDFFFENGGILQGKWWFFDICVFCGLRFLVSFGLHKGNGRRR